MLMVVDRLTKYGHFLALTHPFTTLTIAQEYMVQQVHKLHGIPKSMVSGRDKIFVSNFWQELFKQLGARLHLSTAYHPQIDGQIEVLNKCLEGYLRCMTGECPSEWLIWLPLTEWWYSTTYHLTIQTTCYEALYGQSPPLHPTLSSWIIPSGISWS